ncbi:CHAD domain-containing protein [Streptomyces sp. Z26]|uniref:CHAD domain-containing protein n=1 Tax=Streptomyces sp. Z26 TaxID=2500177 RepID=UPI001F0C62DF|nr:CHAD domain-containing protein [Streptomyces sp. Z26]
MGQQGDTGAPATGERVGARPGRPPLRAARDAAGGRAGVAARAAARPTPDGAAGAAGVGGAAGARAITVPGPAAATGAPAAGAAPTTAGTGPGAAAGDVLGAYLHTEATGFLRSLRVHGESAGSPEAAAEATAAVLQLRRSARRMSGALHTYRPLVDTGWADHLRTELSWLSGTLAREYAYAARLDRLLAALHRLASDGSGPGFAPAGKGGTAAGGALPVGAARAGALLERQLTLARTRAHSAALQALGSSRFHAVADAVAVLASEAPIAPDTDGRTAEEVLPPLAEAARRRLNDAVDMLPLARAEHPYNAEALSRSLAAEVQGDTSWHQVRLLLRLHRYAQEVLLRMDADEGDAADAEQPPAPDAAGTARTRRGAGGPHGPDGHARAAVDPYADQRLAPASRALDRHRDAAEAASAAASAARTPRIAPATAYALGVLHADQRHEVEAARFAFGRLWTARTGERGGTR